MTTGGSGKPASKRIAGAADQRQSDSERSAADTDRTASGDDQTGSDEDQTRSDEDQTGSERDDASAARDQRAADQDQASADQQKRSKSDGAAQETYEATRITREASTISRLATHMARATTTRSRAETAAERDESAAERDESARRADVRAAAIERSIAASNAPAGEKLEQVRARAAADRTRAAVDRDRAAQDRAHAARARARLESELYSAHLDDLTGAFRREAGRLALTHEIERARRADGRFVIAFVDVDRMKHTNDKEGHAAGDRVLQTLVWAMRSQLRSYDPVVRYGGDEFVCGLGGVDLDEVERRFDAIGRAVQIDVGVGISVGLAALAAEDTLDELTARADIALLMAKKRHRE